MSHLVIVGATGVLGNATAKLFLKNNLPVKALVRNPAKAFNLEQAGAVIIKGDLIKGETLNNIFSKNDIVLAAAHGMIGKGKYTSSAVDDKGHKSLIDAAVKAGIQQFIYTSAYGASPDHPIDFFRTKYLIEQYLINSGLNYTILRPAAFMEWHIHNLLGDSLVKKGKAFLPGKGNTPANFISAEDIAELIFYIYKKEEFYNQTIELSGPDNLTKNEVASLYSKHLNKKTSVNHIPRGVLQAFSVLLKPVHPGLARIMKVGLHADRVDASLDDNTSIQRFGITPTKAEDFIKEQVINTIK
jgi:NADH dehydrogenase